MIIESSERQENKSENISFSEFKTKQKSLKEFKFLWFIFRQLQRYVNNLGTDCG